MKLFKVGGSGYYLGFHGIVLATDRTQAEQMLKAWLDSTGLAEDNQRPDAIQIEEISLEQPGLHILFTGDY